MAINFNYELDFSIPDEGKYSDWIARVVDSEGYRLSDLNYIFCNDEYLWNLNKKYLNHDTLTDIITFDYSDDEVVSGDIFISKDRVGDNALKFGVGFDEEMRRVMAHGVLHMMGYKDKSKAEKELMRTKENEKIDLFHVEH